MVRPRSQKHTTYNYSGKANTPTVTVTWNGPTLEQGADKDYTISYQDNIGAGTAAAVIVKGTGKTLTGTRKVTFTINKIAQKPTIKVSKVTGGKTHSFAVSGAYGTLTAKTGSTAIATASTSGKTVKVKGVKAGKTKLTVTVHGDRNHTDATISAAITVLPGAPTKLTAASAAKGLKLTWTKVPGRQCGDLHGYSSQYQWHQVHLQDRRESSDRNEPCQQDSGLYQAQ